MALFEERKRLEQEDGEPLHTLRVMPDQEVAVQCRGAGVLVVGAELTKEIEARVVRPLAELGYFVVAIGIARGRMIPGEIAVNDIASALLYLKELAGGKLGVIGLDLAMPIVMDAATKLPQIDSVVVSGGPGPSKQTKLARVRSSILVLRGAKTSRVTEQDYAEMAARVAPAMQQLVVRNFDASDTFFTRPTEDELDCATEAFDRTSDFLAQTLL